MNCSMNCKIKKIRTLFALPLIAIFFAAPFAVPLAAQDFGLLLNQYGSFGHIDGAAAGENQFEYRIGIVPRFSVNFNDNSSLFISAGVSASRSDDFDIIPELLRTEFSWSSGHLGLNIGRIPYADPLGFIANGLFDGIQFTHTSQAGRFGFGAWYTGFLFKDTANITMTQADQLLYAAPFDINNFADTYFASSRLLASISYENLAIADFMRLNAAVVGQFDLNDADETLNTQYLILRLGLPVNNVFFQLGGSLAAMQSDGSFNLAFSGEFGLYWTIPSGLGNRLSFNVRTASWNFSDDDSADPLFGAFVPVTNIYFGEIFQARMTALSVFSLNYSSRLSRTLGANIGVSYFMRHDLQTPNTFPIGNVGGADNGEFLLGAEMFARLVWSPFSDLQFNLGGGAFIPALGNNWPDESPIWQINLSAILAVF